MKKAAAILTAIFLVSLLTSCAREWQTVQIDRIFVSCPAEMQNIVEIGPRKWKDDSSLQTIIQVANEDYSRVIMIEHYLGANYDEMLDLASKLASGSMKSHTDSRISAFLQAVNYGSLESLEIAERSAFCLAVTPANNPNGDTIGTSYIVRIDDDEVCVLTFQSIEPGIEEYVLSSISIA